MLTTVEGATPETQTPTATVTTPQAGVTPVIYADTAAEIAALKRDLDSANARIGELNKSEQKYRLLQKSVEEMGATPDTLKTKIDSMNTELASYRAIGKIDEIDTRLKDGQKAIDETVRTKHTQEASAACALAGIDYNDLSTRKGVDDWKFEIKTEEREGKSVKVPYATFTEGDKEQSAPLLEHAVKTFPTIARASENGTGLQAPTVSNNGVWISQGVEQGGKSVDIVGSTLNSRYIRPDKKKE